VIFGLTRSLRSLRSAELIVLRPAGKAGSAFAVLSWPPAIEAAFGGGRGRWRTACSNVRRQKGAHG
jgi:hypothetical protein